VSTVAGEKIQALFGKIGTFNYEDTLKNILQSIKKPNILVCGGTGVGKSSLINYVFDKDVAEVGSGTAVTDEIRRYASSNASIVLYDTIGYEIGAEKQKEFYQKVIQFVKQRNSQSDVAQHIHLIWYCISAANKRVTPMDIEAISDFAKTAKISIALTQADSTTDQELKDMEKVLQTELPQIQYFVVSVDERMPKESLGWDALVKWSMDNLDSGLQLAFAQALGQELDVKKEQADTIIKRYMLAAAGAVATPLPMTDSAALIALQTTMATHIFNYWGIDKMNDKIKEIFINVVVANTGRMVSRTLLKFIPGVGSITSFLINGSVATSFTYAFGTALNEICYQMATRLAKGEQVDPEKILTVDFILKTVEKYYKH
jgi:uncharacterized protein (DUF697 family)/GTP-binding protein EngB required for normal cell division